VVVFGRRWCGAVWNGEHTHTTHTQHTYNTHTQHNKKQQQHPHPHPHTHTIPQPHTLTPTPNTSIRAHTSHIIYIITHITHHIHHHTSYTSSHTTQLMSPFSQRSDSQLVDFLNLKSERDFVALEKLKPETLRISQKVVCVCVCDDG